MFDDDRMGEQVAESLAIARHEEQQQERPVLQERKSSMMRAALRATTWKGVGFSADSVTTAQRRSLLPGEADQTSSKAVHQPP
jgi:hypothetical protein